MSHEHLLLKELNHALEIYSESETNKYGAYNVLFSPLHKASKILLENKISIFNLEQEENLFNENLNGLGKLLISSVKARNILLESNLGLVGKIAKKYAQKFPQLEYGDVKSEGVFGLLKAIEKYNPHLNVPFPHYALPMVEDHIKRNLNIYLRTIKLPVNFIFNYRTMLKFENEFKEKFTIKPNNEELAEFMGKSVGYTKELKANNKKFYDLVSLDIPVFKESDENYLIDKAIDSHSSSLEDRVINKIIFQDSMQNYISKLPEKQGEVLLKRLGNKTFVEIAVCAGEENLMITKSKKILTKQRIEAIYSKGVRKVRKMHTLKNI